MRPGVTTFVLVVDASGLGKKHFDLARDKQLLRIGLFMYEFMYSLLCVCLCVCVVNV
jgi:hypothetical protein